MLRDERGVTLVELLVAVAITGMLAVAIARTTTAAQTSIERSSAQTMSSVQTTRFVAMLKYDLAGASDVYLFDATAPGATAPLCTSWTTGDTDAWTDASNPQFVRQLFSVDVPTVTSPSSPGTTAFLSVRTQRIGYEVRRQSASAAIYDLYRVVCDGGKSAQRMLTLGADLQSGAAGTTSMSCFNAAGTAVTVPAGSSTMSLAVPVAQRCASFTFAVPYTGSATAIRRLLGDTVLQRMSSMVGAA